MARDVEKLKDEGSHGQAIAAGAIAGLVSRFVIAPLDVIKIRLQLQIHSLSDPFDTHVRQRPRYNGTLGTLKQILRDEGITGLWKGNVPAEALYICYGGMQFSSYRISSHALGTLPDPYRPPESAINFISGAVAGTVATTTTYPLDLLRTRFAAQGTDRIYDSLAHSIRSIHATEGPAGFFRGLSAGVSQIIPYMGLFFASYEALKLPLADLHLPFGSGDAVAGTLASVLAKSAVYPLDTARKRLQVQGPLYRRHGAANGTGLPLDRGVVGTVVGIARREGVRSLYRGLPVSLLKAAPTSAITMWTYERAMAVMIAMDRHLAGEDDD